jgi:hypothetical protein
LILISRRFSLLTPISAPRTGTRHGFRSNGSSPLRYRQCNKPRKTNPTTRHRQTRPTHKSSASVPTMHSSVPIQTQLPSPVDVQLEKLRTTTEETTHATSSKTYRKDKSYKQSLLYTRHETVEVAVDWDKVYGQYTQYQQPSATIQHDTTRIVGKSGAVWFATRQQQLFAVDITKRKEDKTEAALALDVFLEADTIFPVPIVLDTV